MVAIWLALVAVAVWGQRNSNRRLRSIAVEHGGLWFGDARRDKAEFVPWGQIKNVEPFAYPHRDAVYMHDKSGIRLQVGDRDFFIYEHIGEYAHLSEILKRKVSIR